jgi:hypothetical protein
MGAPGVEAGSFRGRIARSVLLVGSCLCVGCVVYDETLLGRENGGGAGGPSTAFVTSGTGWSIGTDGALGTGGAAPSDAGAPDSEGKGDSRDVGAGAGGASGSEGSDGGTPARPTAVTITTMAASPLVAPSTSGTGYFRSCARDAVVIGYTGTVNPPEVLVNYLRSFQAICASLAVTGSTTYAVETRQSETLAQVGDTLGSLVQTVVCPPSEIVVGFGVRSGSFIDSIAFSCARLVVSSTPSGYALSLGTKTTMGIIGGPRGMTFTQAECAAGMVAVGHTGKAGRDIDSFGLLCGTPALVVE